MVCRMAQPTVMDQKLNALFDELDRTYETGVINPEEILRLATDIHRESSVPIFVQKLRREAGKDGRLSTDSYRPATF
jgi:hypothetical protein